MATPNGSVAAGEQALAETPEVPEAVADALTPLLSTRDVLLTERTAIAEQLAAKDQEIKVVDKVLRAGGLLDSPHKAKPKGKPKAAEGISPAMLERGRDAVRILAEDVGEFTTKELAAEMQVAELTASKVIHQLRAMGELHLAGKKVPRGSKNPSNKASHFAARAGA